MEGAWAPAVGQGVHGVLIGVHRAGILACGCDTGITLSVNTTRQCKNQIAMQVRARHALYT